MQRRSSRQLTVGIAGKNIIELQTFHIIEVIIWVSHHYFNERQLSSKWSALEPGMRYITTYQQKVLMLNFTKDVKRVAGCIKVALHFLAVRLHTIDCKRCDSVGDYFKPAKNKLQTLDAFQWEQITKTILIKSSELPNLSNPCKIA